jgi:hypothetical protein
MPTREYADQYAAAKIGLDTVLPSLELGRKIIRD